MNARLLNRFFSFSMSLLMASASQKALAQDPVFSQPYLAPVYLNPAATGAGENDFRVSLIHRRQWLTIPSQFNYTAFSVDKFIPSIKGGLGFMATDFSTGYLKRTGLYGSYSYTICSGEPNVARNEEMQTWFVTGGLQFGMVQRRLDYSKLVFSDQLNENGYIPGSTSGADPLLFNKKWYPDFSGGLYFSHEIAGRGNLLLGASARHLNTPDESLTSGSDTFRSPRPMLWAANANYTYDGEEWTWGIALLGYKQGNSRSAQFGVTVKPASYDFSVGVWGHAGNSISSFNALTVSITYTFRTDSPRKQKLAIGYAQDFPMGGSGFSYTTGSSELGLTWDVESGNNVGTVDTDNRCKPHVSLTACPGGVK